MTETPDMQAGVDLSSIPIFDHHTHSLLRERGPLSMTGFQRFFTEAEAPIVHADYASQTLFFRWAVKELASFFDCDSTPQAVLRASNAVPPDDLAARMYGEANIPALLIDYGFGASANLSPDELAAIIPSRVGRILRLETMAQDLIQVNDTYEQFLDAFTDCVEQAQAEGHASLKSVIAYRTGLAIREWGHAEAGQAFYRVKEKAIREGNIRLADQPLNDSLVLRALEIAEAQQMPFQLHTGFGDPDLDLLLANPLHLRSLLHSGKYSHVPFILLHAGYPYVRELSYLTSVYPNVFLDLSLAIPQAASDIPNLLQAALSLAPTNKVLFSTDAYSIPEITWIASRWGRWGLGKVLGTWLEQGMISSTEVDEIGNQILHGNAEKVYGVPS